MNDLEVFVAMLHGAKIPCSVGPANGLGGATTRVEIFEQNRAWKLAALFDFNCSLISIGTYIPPGQEYLLSSR